MIVSEKSQWLGGRITSVRTPMFMCVVSTCRDGFLGSLTTMIIDDRDAAGDAGGTLCGSIIYAPGLRRRDILELHGTVVRAIDEGGRMGLPLGEALREVIESLEKEGYATGGINAAQWGHPLAFGEDSTGGPDEP